MVTKVWFVTLLVLLSFGGHSAFAADPSEVDLRNYDLRLTFLEDSLQQSAKHARYWQNGWTTFYAASAVAQTILWIDADKNDESVNYSVGAVKSVGGMVDMLLRPHPGRYGAEPLLSMPEQSQQRLAKAERLLRDSAARAASRYEWQPHLKVFGVNLLGGALIAAFGDEGDALVSSLLGVAIGEANIWSQPTRAEGDWREYQQRFSSGSQSGVSWQLVPMVGGLAVLGRF